MMAREFVTGEVEVGEHTAADAGGELIIEAAADHAEVALATLPLHEWQGGIAAAAGDEGHRRVGRPEPRSEERRVGKRVGLRGGRGRKKRKRPREARLVEVDK